MQHVFMKQFNLKYVNPPNHESILKLVENFQEFSIVVINNHLRVNVNYKTFGDGTLHMAVKSSRGFPSRVLDKGPLDVLMKMIRKE